MRLQSKLLVDYTAEQVTDFFYHPSSLAKWDKSVTEMIPISNAANATHAAFDTIAPSGKRMNYEVIELNADKSVKIKLLNSKMFKQAIWHFQFVPVGQTTEIICSVHIKLRLLYIFLYPVLYFNRSALLRDLRFLRDALDENYRTEQV